MLGHGDRKGRHYHMTLDACYPRIVVATLAVAMSPIAVSPSCFFEAQENAAQLDLVVVVQDDGGFAREFLTIEEGEVGAILVFEHVLAVLYEDARVQAGDAALFAAMRRQVYVGEDVADSIFATDDDVVFAAQVKFLVIGFYD